MLQLLNNLFLYARYGWQYKVVLQYIRSTTPESLLDDLPKALLPKLSAFDGLWTTFEASCFQASPQEDQYWTKESLRKHIEKAHPYTVFSDTAIDLLWTCFYFYAYHPFPRRDVYDGKIKWPAFQRSVAFLAGQGIETKSFLKHGGCSWNRDASFTRIANFSRILRSISRPEDPDDCTTETPASTSAVNDVTDALAMSLAQDISVAPFPSLLKPAAEALISKSAGPTQFRVNGRELSILLSLILRLKLYKIESTQELYNATFDEPCPQDDEFAHVMADRLVGFQDINLTPNQIQRCFDLLPNLEFYFHQLWLTLFKPPMNANKPEDEKMQLESTEKCILRALSLFISPHMFFKSFETAEEIQPLTFQMQSGRNFRDHLLLSLYRSLAAAVEGNAVRTHSFLYVIVGNIGSLSPSLVVMGTYSPGLFSTTNCYEERKTALWKSRFASSHILFQLQPTFRLLKWTGTHSPTYLDFVSEGDKSAHDYWLGAPGGKNAGLHFNTNTNLATLKTIATPTENGSSGRYEDIGVEQNGDGDRKESIMDKEKPFLIESSFGFDNGSIAVDRAGGKTKQELLWESMGTKPFTSYWIKAEDGH